MKYSKKMSLIILIAMLLSLVNPVSVFADEVIPSTNEETETSTVQDENTEVEPSLEVTELPIIQDNPTSEPASLPNLETEAVSETLEQLPENTELIVLDENGNVEPLATKEAEEAIIIGDPVWCPSTLSAPTPGANGCTNSYTSFQALLNYLDANEPSQAGTIWIESSYDSSVNDTTASSFEINNGYFTTMGNYALTIQGGWSGISGDNSIGASSIFNGDHLYIYWGANITINNINVQNTSNHGISVFTNGDINLNNIQSNHNSSHGVDIRTFGSVNINNTSTQGNSWTGIFVDNRGFPGDPAEDVSIQNSNTSDNQRGVFIISNGNIDIDNLTSNGNSDVGVEIYNNESGATGEINIENSNFSSNGGGGTVHSNNNITLNSVVSSQNSIYGGVGLVNTYGSGNIFVENSIFSNNMNGGGVGATSYGSITLSNVVANGNHSGAGIEGYGAPVFISSSTFNSNTYYGIDAEYTTASLFLNNVSFDCLNGWGDFIYNSTIYTACEEVPSPEEEPNSPEPVSFSLNTLLVNEGENIELDCVNYSGTKLVLENGNLSTFNCPITGFVSLSTLENENLPAELPEGVEYVSGLVVTQNPQGSDVALDSLVIISFVIPNDVIGKELAILYWTGTEWVDLATATFDDGRMIFNGGYISPNGYFEAFTNFVGNFVLVTK